MNESQRIQKKLYRVASVILAVIGILFLLYSTLGRISDAKASEDYILTTGTVSKVSLMMERSTSRNHTEHETYCLWVHYQPKGYLLEECLTTDNVFREPRAVGEEMLVMYHKDRVYEAYLAKRDWMTGKYISLIENYDQWIGMALVTLAGAFWTRALSLQWEKETVALKMLVVAIGIGVIGIIIFIINQI